MNTDAGGRGFIPHSTSASTGFMASNASSISSRSAVMFRRFMASASMADLSFEQEISTRATTAMASCSNNNNELYGVVNGRMMEMVSRVAAAEL